MTYNFKMRGALECSFRFIIDFVVELSQPPMKVWVIVADLFPIAIEHGVVSNVETNRCREKPAVDLLEIDDLNTNTDLFTRDVNYDPTREANHLPDIWLCDMISEEIFASAQFLL